MRRFLLFLMVLCCIPAFAQAKSSLPDVGKAYKSGAKNPKDAAVVIAIENYPILGSDYTVTYATRDGDGMENFLVYTRGVPSSRVRRLDKPNASAIMQAVTEAANQVEDGGTLWVYFAGHAGVDPNTKDRMLLPYNITAENPDLQREAVALSAIQKLGQQSKAKSVMLIIDACNVQLAKGKRFVAPASLSVQSKVSVWSATTENEASGPFEPVKHGAFTYAALGALRGWADGEVDGERDGNVDAQEATQYVRRFLREIQVTDQTPEFVGNREFILSQGKETPPSDDAIMDARRSANKKTDDVPVKTETKTSTVTKVYEPYNPHTNNLLRRTGQAMLATGALGLLVGGVMMGIGSDDAEFHDQDPDFFTEDGKGLMTAGKFTLIGSGVAIGLGSLFWGIAAYRDAAHGYNAYVAPTGNGMMAGFRW